MRLSNKNSNSFTSNITFEGGINVSEPATNIADNELQDCLNLFYSNQERYLTTRTGIKIIDVPAMSHPIEKLYEYIKDENNIFLVAVSNGQMFYLKSEIADEVETLSWVKITDLTNSTILPTMVTYSSKLVFADRGSTLRTWDGTTVSTIATSPSYSTIVEVINGRLVCNSEGVGELDALYFCAPYNMNEWNTNNGAVGMRAGYGDGKRITGLGVIANDVIVFKEGGLTYRVSCQGTTSSWYVQPLFANNTTSNQSSIEPVGNDLVFGSSTGINSVMTVKEYGDLKVNHLGMKVSSLLNGKGIRESVWSSYYGVLFLLIEGLNTILVFHPHIGAYTIFDFGIKINSICNGRNYTYFADNTGLIYKNTNLSVDELTKDVFTNIHTRLVTKTFTSPDEMLLKKTRLYLEQIDSTKGSVHVYDRTGRIETKIYNWLPSYAGFIYDATEYIYDATDYLNGDALSYFDIYNQYQDQAFSFIIDVELGRVKIKNISANISTVST